MRGHWGQGVGVGVGKSYQAVKQGATPGFYEADLGLNLDFAQEAARQSGWRGTAG